MEMKTLNSLLNSVHERLQELVPALKPMVSESIESLNAKIGTTWALVEPVNVGFVDGGDRPFERTAWDIIDSHGNIEMILFDVTDSCDLLEIFLSVENDLLALGFPVDKFINVEKATVRLHNEYNGSFVSYQSCSNYFFHDIHEAAKRDKKIRQMTTTLTDKSWGAVAGVFESLPEYSLLFNVHALQDWHKECVEWYEYQGEHEWYEYASLDVNGNIIKFVTPTSSRVVTVDTEAKSLSVYFPLTGSVTAAGMVANNLGNHEATFVSVSGDTLATDIVASYCQDEEM